MTRTTPFAHRLRAAIVIMALPVAALLIHWLYTGPKYVFGVHPRFTDGLDGILTMPLVHGDWGHLFSNFFPLVALSWLIHAVYRNVLPKVLPMVWILGGILLWCWGRPVYHVGASGVVYGLWAFLFVMGMIRGERKAMAAAFAVITLYSGIIWGMFPLEEGISWDGHLSGAVAGLVMALAYRNHHKEPKVVLPDDDGGLPYWMYDVEGGLKEEYRQPQVRYILRPDESENSDQEPG